MSLGKHDLEKLVPEKLAVPDPGFSLKVITKHRK